MTERVDKTWVRWGSELRRLRRLAGKTQTAISGMTLISRPQIGKLENGTRTPNRDHAVELDDALATDGRLLQLWEELNDVKRVPDEWEDFVRIERTAVEIREYQPLLIPGLVQAPGYARAILGAGRLDSTPELLEHALETRLGRLAELRRHVALRFVVDEHALRQRRGSPEAMKEQFDHLLSLIDQQRIRLSVLPDHAARHPVVGGSFRIFGLPGGSLVVHLEHAKGQVVVHDAEEVNAMAAMYGDLQAESLPSDASVALIEKVRGEL
ncbi:helix-turn-helix domain-containing protein [Nocardiopsis mangrovi]|uniref:Helix-turn-helix domain-containing protein n=1 Tax=Nocardiopsis mangrovi TaxID=1179818 RepID=A0ABV9E4I0_9ACTN